MKHVACYCRVSTDEQVKYGFSIQAQKDALEKYCKENGYKYTFFIDEGISASSMKKRESLNNMLSKSRVFDMVLFTKLDRLSRNVLDANNIHKILQENNCTMKAIDEDDVDTSTADGMFIFNLKISLAQREIGKTSERIKFVFKNKRENGEVTTNQKKYGYDIINKKYVINESEAENIKKLYKYVIQTSGNMKEVYSYFLENIGSFTYKTMARYLRDESYIGKYKMYYEDTYIDNFTPVILEEELFNQVQKILNMKNRIIYPDCIDLFSGLVFCSKCERRFSKKIDRRISTQPILYRCCNNSVYAKGSLERKCSNSKAIRENKIEKYLLTNLEEEFKKYKLTIDSIKKLSIKKTDPNKIKSLENKLDKLKDLYLDDLIDKNRYKKDYEKYTKELNKLKKDEVSAMKIPDLSNVESLLNSDYIKIYNSLDKENKKRFWVSLIDKIYIDDGEVKKVTFI